MNTMNPTDNYCPLLLIVASQSGTQWGECIRHSCALYDYDNKSCALLSIARSLREENKK